MAKNIVKTARRQLGGRHLLSGKYFAELDKPKHKISKIKLNIDAGKLVLAMLLFKLGIILND